MQLGCCGYNSNDDWVGVLTENKNGMSVPDSCCARSDAFDHVGKEEKCFGIYENGCIGRLSLIVQRSAFFLGAGAMLIALIQVNC